MSLFHVTVPPHTERVEYRHGAYLRTLGPGRHPRVWRVRTRFVDTRESIHTLQAQEIPTADAVTVRVSAAVRWAVTDSRTFLERSIDPVGALHLAAQTALREAVAGLDVAQLTRQSLSAAGLTAAVAALAGEYGITVREVVVKDVLVPNDLRQATLDLLTARTRGAAQLEAARAETAALRSLANAAALLDRSPALAQLRLVEKLPHGSQVRLTVPSAPQA